MNDQRQLKQSGGKLIKIRQRGVEQADRGWVE